MQGLFVLVLSLIVWGSWYFQLARAYAPAVSTRWRIIAGLPPVLCLTAFTGIFYRYADASALDDAFWSAAFPVIAAMSLRLTVAFLHVLPLQLPADVTERANPAVIPAFAGALLGVTALNVGSNLGQGVEASSTLFPLACSWLIWAAFAVATAFFTTLLSATVAERKTGASARLGLIWLTAGLVLARADAGDWVSYEATTIDLLSTLPALVGLLAAARWLERHLTLLVVACLAIATISLALPHASAWHLP